MITAAQLNEHLLSGGVVVVSTYTKSIIYSRKHAGWFEQVGNEVYVKHGRRKDLLTNGGKPIVSIKCGRFVKG